jgi:hypothetical protein
VSDGYAGERTVIGTLLAANWTACPIFGPNERIDPPDASSDPAEPASYLAWDLSYDDARQITMDGGDQVDGSIDVTVAQERHSGDSTIRAHMDSLDALFSAVDSPAIHFRTGVPGDYEPDDTWYYRLYSIPFVRFDLLSAEDLATLAGVGSTSRTIHQDGHGFAVGDWLAWDSGTNQWIKALAATGEPRCDGVVSEVSSADAFQLTATGVVRLLGHGWADGPLYLSQSTRGLGVTVPPSSGVSRLLATVIGSNDIIVLSTQEVVL